MPIPNQIQNSPHAYAHVWTGPLLVGAPVGPQGALVQGANKTRQFITYIEVLEQGAHDPAIRTLVQQRNMIPRPMHRGRVAPLNNLANPLAYYATHGQESARIVSRYMAQRWSANPNKNNAVFTVNVAHPLAVQGQIQPNGFSYDITMYYDVATIYVVFHCYHQ